MKGHHTGEKGIPKSFAQCKNHSVKCHHTAAQDHLGDQHVEYISAQHHGNNGQMIDQEENHQDKQCICQHSAQQTTDRILAQLRRIMIDSHISLCLLQHPDPFHQRTGLCGRDDHRQRQVQCEGDEPNQKSVHPIGKE